MDLYAFWKYDLYPFVLGGHVVKMREDGSVETKEYGHGSYFKPILIMPSGPGEKLAAEIKELGRAHSDAIAELNREWRNKIPACVNWKGSDQ